MTTPYEDMDDDGAISPTDATVSMETVVSTFPKWPDTQGVPQPVTIVRHLP